MTTVKDVCQGLQKLLKLPKHSTQRRPDARLLAAITSTTTAMDAHAVTHVLTCLAELRVRAQDLQWQQLWAAVQRNSAAMNAERTGDVVWALAELQAPVQGKTPEELCALVAHHGASMRPQDAVKTLGNLNVLLLRHICPRDVNAVYENLPGFRTALEQLMPGLGSQNPASGDLLMHLKAAIACSAGIKNSSRLRRIAQIFEDFQLPAPQELSEQMLFCAQQAEALLPYELCDVIAGLAILKVKVSGELQQQLLGAVEQKLHVWQVHCIADIISSLSELKIAVHGTLVMRLLGAVKRVVEHASSYDLADIMAGLPHLDAPVQGALLEGLLAAAKCNATSMTGDEAADIVWGFAEFDVGLDGEVLQSMLAGIERTAASMKGKDVERCARSLAKLKAPVQGALLQRLLAYVDV